MYYTVMEKNNIRRHKKNVFVFFDLETTGLDSNESDIIQIAAKGSRYWHRRFSCYLTTKKTITRGATKANRLTKDMNGNIVKNGQRMDTVGPKKALEAFLDWLDDTFPKERVILVAHNGFKFDVPILMNHLRRYGLLIAAIHSIYGFADTLPSFRENYNHLKSHSLPELSKQMDVVNDDPHDALSDVKALITVTRRGAAREDIRFDKFVLSNSKPLTDYIISK